MRFVNNLIYTAKIVRANITKKWLPLTVSLTVTNRCNLRCIYCYGAYYNRSIRDFPTGFWTGLIDELHGMGTKLIHLEGGEPLLRDDIGVLVDHVKSKGMLCRMNSNGYLVPKKIREVSRLDSLCISLDGDEESNDKNRGKGSYQKILEAVRTAKRHGLPVLTSTTLTSHNIDNGSIEHVLSLAAEIGFGAQFNFLYDLTKDNTDDPACRVRQDSIRKALLKLIEYKKQGLPVFYSMATYRNSLNWPAPYSVKRFTAQNPAPAGFRHLPCFMGKLMCFVDGDGKVYPCGEHIGKFPALSILDAGFKKAWENIAERKECYTCYNTCFNEYNEIFAMNAGVLWNNFRNYLRNRGRRPAAG